MARAYLLRGIDWSNPAARRQYNRGQMSRYRAARRERAAARAAAQTAASLSWRPCGFVCKETA